MHGLSLCDGRESWERKCNLPSSRFWHSKALNLLPVGYLRLGDNPLAAVQSERRRHNAEVDCEDVLLKLKEANEERQELLAFQARAVDAIRHQEIASLKQRIQHLEHSRGAGRGNAAQAQSQPSCDREEEASGVQAASRARARLEEAVARDATGFYASASNRGSSSGYVCAIPGFRGDSADSLPPDMEGPGSNTCERKLPSASSCPTGISMLDCSSIGLALKEPEEELVETCDPHDQGGADLPQQSETQDVGSTGRHAQTDQSQVKAPSREHSMSGGSGEPWTSDCQHGAQKPLRPSTAGAHSPKLRRERSLGHVSRAYPPWAQQLVAESSAPALGAASTKSSLMRSVMSVRYHQQQSSHVRTGNAAARHQARPDLKRAGSARHTSQTAAEELHSLMDPYTYHNVAQVSGRGANGAGLQIKGMKPTRMEDGAMTCLRPNGRIAVSQRP